MAPDITIDDLDREVRNELRSLPMDLAEVVGRHLVAAERALVEEEVERAYAHAKAARRLAARVGVVREAAGIVAYRAGQYAEALSDLRAARRLNGSDAYLPVMADCERGLGRPERALDLVKSREAERLDRGGRIELAIVESGARRDLGQHDAAVVTLQRLPELRDAQLRPWSARLAFAYADALAEAGHQQAAVDWFARAMAFDEDGETDAAERYAELTGAVIEDVEEEYAEELGEDFDVDLGDVLAPRSEDSEAEPVESAGGDLAVEQSEAVDSVEEAEAAEAAEVAEDAEASADVLTVEASEEPEEPEAAENASATEESVEEDSAPLGVTPAFIEPVFDEKKNETQPKQDDKD